MIVKLNQPKVAVVSDIHIGAHQNSSQWHKVLLEWGEWFKKECREKGLTDIIIPGDLFHERNEINVHTLHVASKLLESWKEFNVIITIGNHDSYYRQRADVHSLEMLKHWDHVTVVDELYTDTYFGKKITFCPWATQDIDIPKCDIVFCHMEISGFYVTKNHVCEKGHDPIALTDIAPLIISGHFHLKDERVFKNGIILYTGCAFELYWGDYNNTKGYYILDIPTSTYTFYENNISPKHKKVFLSQLKKEGLTDEIKQDIKNNWVKFLIDEKVSDDKLLVLVEKLRSLGPLDIKVEYIIDDKGFSTDGSFESVGIDIVKSIEEYVESMEVEHKEEIINYILDMYGKVT